ncbi:helicase-related protein [Thiohalorhabdus methylotrophus]|uniref:RNA helicase n=1 Tax=Thiohalorhabdus methylotrophus TaxID=3242694 RepID=A0ABV4U0P7_9GAMM
MVSHTLDLFGDGEAGRESDAELAWPPAERFPLNHAGARVQDTVTADLTGSAEPLVVTGFAALAHLLDTTAELTTEGPLRILFGTEPLTDRLETIEPGGRSFPEAVERYWLERGISLRLSARLLAFRERLRTGCITTRYLAGDRRQLHAKLYIGDDAAILGSSNFSASGLVRQWEANARFTRSGEARRYREAREIGENYWALGTPFDERLLELLDRLLQVVDWQEALARAAAELLEGGWAQALLRTMDPSGFEALWPAQRQGIAQALYILDRQGSVLVADATGSGKTRMGAHLIRAVQDRLVRSGALGHDGGVLIGPPAVESEWDGEALTAGAALRTFSHGHLSHSRGERHQRLLMALRQSRLLCVDEAHNFNNQGSNRSRQLLHHMADHVLLFTATPINRGPQDLIRVADLLGADNLEPVTLEAFQQMLRARGNRDGLTPQEAGALRAEIRKFTVRRTKRMFNALIDREPDAYRDYAGRPCRFPEHVPRTYDLDEVEADRSGARRIRALASQLYGVGQLTGRLELPVVLQKQGWDATKYLESRLLSASRLSQYRILAAMRSSRPALVEHLAGTEVAREAFSLEGFHKPDDTGAVIATVRGLRGHPPENHLDVDPPAWLTDSAAHAAACDHDADILEQILEEARALSPARERAKVAHLRNLTRHHERLLAFDSTLITLAHIRALLLAADPEARIWVATGSGGQAEREAVLRGFRPGREGQEGIALCSDSLAEGANLQAASALVHLDMPSVVRVAEQRTGRVDRMDSPHPRIEVWWPRDDPAFALTADERFVQRHAAVDQLLGSNLPLPEALQRTSGESVPTETLITEYEKAARFAETGQVEDAFESVRGLVEGPQALVDAATYEHYRTVSARVMARVSVVPTDTPWAFFCLAGSGERAPRWILLPSLDEEPQTTLEAVSDGLRRRLASDTGSMALDQSAAETLGRFVDRLAEAERGLLPRKKQRALTEMGAVLAGFERAASSRRDQPALEAYRAVRDVLERPDGNRSPDWEIVATRWLELVRPVWYRRLGEPRRARPLLLADIRDDLIAQEAELGPRALAAFRTVPEKEPPERRIAAAILGWTGPAAN